MKVTFVDKRISAERTVKQPMNEDHASVYHYVQGSLQDAEREIAKAFMLQTQGLGYAMQDMNRVDGGRGEEEREYSDHEIEIMSMLPELKKNIPSATYGIVLDRCSFCSSLDQIAYERNMRKGAVIKALVEGLEEWCDLRGMR